MKDASNKTLNLLRSAVHNQMVSDVPLGTFLSGGLDSSSILRFALEVDPKNQIIYHRI